MTTHKPHGAIPPLPPVEAPAPLLAEARANCAANLIQRGYPEEADQFAAGNRDWEFPMRYEVKRLRDLAEKP